MYPHPKPYTVHFKKLFFNKKKVTYCRHFKKIRIPVFDNLKFTIIFSLKIIFSFSQCRTPPCRVSPFPSFFLSFMNLVVSRIPPFELIFRVNKKYCPDLHR